MGKESCKGVGLESQSNELNIEHKLGSAGERLDHDSAVTGKLGP